MADVIWSCPQCGIDLVDYGGQFWCWNCGRYFAPPAVMVPDDE